MIIACKNDLAHSCLAEQLKEHSITRRYQAIVHGVLKEDEGTVDAPIGRHPVERKKMSINYNNGREAVTHYKVLRRFRQYTHVECRLETGRTHQIRVHMASIHHPLLGDAVYGPAGVPFRDCRGRHYTPVFWASAIPGPEPTWSSPRPFRTILPSCCGPFRSSISGAAG